MQLKLPLSLSGLWGPLQFGAATQFDRFSLERLELMRNPDLAPEQRTKAIQQAELAWLTPAQREQRQQFTV